MRIIILIFIGSLLFFSCKDDKEDNQKPELKLIDKGFKFFDLDDETNYENIGLKLNKIDGKDYISFFNRNNWSIYFYDYATGKIHNKVTMQKEGPDAVAAPYFFLEYFAHNTDSIFINTHKFYYLVNSQGKLLDNGALNSEENKSFFEAKNLSFDNATYYKNNTIYCGLNTSLSKSEIPLLRGAFNLESKKIENEQIAENILVKDYDAVTQIKSELAKNGGMTSLDKYFVRNEEYLLGSTSISDSIYLFKDDNLIKTIYASDPDIKTANFKSFFDRWKVETFEGGGISISSKGEQPPFFTDMLIDPNEKFIYRILIHGTKPVFNEELKRELPEVIGTTLVVVNIESGTVHHFELPMEEISVKTYARGLFVNDAGIHFPVREQENENEIRYKVFKVE